MASQTCTKSHKRHPLLPSHDLLQAVKNGVNNDIEKYLSRGADVEWTFENYGTVLQTAACIGDEEIVTLLLTKGTNVNAQSGQYGNALQAAAARGHEKTVKLLLDAGADCVAKGGIYGTALEAALRTGYPCIAELLVPERCAKSVEWCTYLHLAASKGYNGVVQMLMLNGGYTDFEKQEVTISALTQGRTSTAKQLIQEFGDLGHSGPRILNAAISVSNVDLIRLLVEKGIHVDEQSLVLAVQRDANGLLGLLIKGYQGDIRWEGMLAAEEALKGGHLDSAELLFKRGVWVEEDLLMRRECGASAETLMLKYASRGLKNKFKNFFA